MSILQGRPCHQSFQVIIWNMANYSVLGHKTKGVPFGTGLTEPATQALKCSHHSKKGFKKQAAFLSAVVYGYFKKTTPPGLLLWIPGAQGSRGTLFPASWLQQRAAPHSLPIKQAGQTLGAGAYLSRYCGSRSSAS